jgi:hypothetical protein
MLIVTLRCATTLPAQTIRVDVVDSVSGGGVVGALVSPMDAAGQPGADRITDAQGVALVRVATAGVWRVRIRRIGFPPYLSTPIDVPATGIVTIRAVLTSSRQSLPRVDVTASTSSCGTLADSSQRAAVLWDQLSLALRSAAVTRLEQRTPLRVTLLERDVDLNLHALSESVTGMLFGSERPFGALDPDSLARGGYVRKDPDGGFRFYAPDDSVLLSESFRAGYCFRAPASVSDTSPALLTFSPVASSRQPGIAGTVELDQETGEPQQIIFRYVQTERVLPMPAPRAGGSLTLRRLASGEWIIPSWMIRMPLFGRAPSDGRMTVLAYREQIGLAEPQSNRRSGAAPEIARPQTSGLRLRVVDDSGRAIARALVYAFDTTTAQLTRVDGSAVVTPDPDGRVRVRIRKIGYTMVDTVLVSRGSDVQTVSLRRVTLLATQRVVDNAPLDRIGFTSRRQLGLGQYLTPEQIERRPAPSALDLLQGMAGVQIYRVPADVPAPADLDFWREWSPGAQLPVFATPTSLTGRGGICLPHMFIDGRQASVAQLASLSSADVLAVEVYKDGTQVPAAFQRPRDDVCGTIVVWTRVENL